MRPTIYLFSDPCSFSLYLLESLLSSLCNVVIFSSAKKDWEDLTLNINRTVGLKFELQKNYKKYQSPNYFLIVDASKGSANEVVDKAETLSITLKTKGFVVILNRGIQSITTLPSDAVGVISLNNLYGPRMELNGEDRISQVIKSAVNNEKIKISERETLTPVYMGDAAKLITKWLFSFGPYGEATSVSSNNLLVTNICQIIKRTYPNFNYRVVQEAPENNFRNKEKTYLLEKRDNKLLEETLLWLKRNFTTRVVSQENKLKIGFGSKVLIAVMVLAAAPFVFILMSAFLLLVSGKTLISENFNTTKILVKTSYFFSNVANKESGMLSSIPVVEQLYKPAVVFSYVLKNTNAAGLRGLDLIDELSALSDNILGGKEYDLGGAQERIVSDLGYIGTTISFIEGELKNYPNLNKKINFGPAKKIISNARKIVSSMEEILGAKKTKTYLVLFQNNMELRPTGGFIGSFALATFNSGGLGEISVQDVYSADGQLKGHVEPPMPINKYLKEANWFLRDSNWDMNFPVSAERAEWFLDKEIDVAVDGVIAIDLNVIKDVLEMVGPVYLNDYQTQVSYENFYEKIQSEVEGNFFPGSIKKAGFITALSRELINTLVLNKENNKVKLAKILYNNLEKRHIQIYLHNNLVKEALGNLNWDGAFSFPSCVGNCYSDTLGVVEANLGVNKANYYIEREYNLSVDLKEGAVVKNLSINYKNNANLAMGEKGIYKNYFRLIVPPDSTVESIKVGEAYTPPDEEMVSGRKEIGFYFELSPGQTKTVNIKWQNSQFLKFNATGQYLIYIRKQAGVPSEPITVLFNNFTGVDLNIEPGYTNLFGKDIYSKVSWKK